MEKIKCPHCGMEITLSSDETAILTRQIRDEAFAKDVESRVAEIEKHMAEKHGAELVTKENQLKISAMEEKSRLEEIHAQEIKALKDKLSVAENEKQRLLATISGNEDKKKIAVMEAVQKAENEKRELEIKLQNEKEKAATIIKEKDVQIEFYKDLKARMSTKMVGETLEQHCENQFNQFRATAFRNAYFEKDNDARTGSKGDYIYKECDEDGTEIVSIMFEMKNEMDTTSTKHKNEDFFKELDKDRREKGCEYAVLVSLLEPDSELYNSGIVDVSYRYDKMYVIRPQCFIPMITILRNTSMNALKYKQELVLAKSQHVDVSNFEDKLSQFKEDFGRNFRIAYDHFEKAIDEIDRTIEHLQKVKRELQGSDNQLRIANNKVDDVSVKKLVKDNPTMKEAFEKIKKQ